MTSCARIISWSLLSLFLFLWVGCSRKPETQADEQKERNYLTGRRRLSALDYNGAVEAFEQAIIVNPRSAAAHFELGVLYEQKLFDYAAAIYHYERALRHRPDLPQAANIRPRIKACKVELADKEALVPVNAMVQKDLDRLTSENIRLRQQVSQLLAQLAQNSAGPSLGYLPARHPTNAAMTNGPRSASSVGTLNTNSLAARPNLSSVVSPITRMPSKPPAKSAPRANSFVLRGTKHVVKRGENAYSIARTYGLKLQALIEVNPGLDPRHLRAGQVLIIPPP